MKWLSREEMLLRVNAESPHNLRGARARPFHQSHRMVLARSLTTLDVAALIFNKVIGSGMIQNTTYMLSLVGSGSILTFAAVATLAGCVMICVSEMVALFPITNAMAEFIYVFVDEELAQLIGWAYWFAYSVFFATSIFSASNLLQYSFPLSNASRTGIAIAFATYIVASNAMSVRAFGTTGIILSALKCCATVAILVVMTVGAADSVQNTCVSDHGTHNSCNYGSNYTLKHFGSTGINASGDGQSFSIATSLAVQCFIGIEMIGVTAAETQNVRKSANMMPYVLLATSCLGVWTLVTGAIATVPDSALIATYHGYGLGGVVEYPRYLNSSIISNFPVQLAVIPEKDAYRRTIDVLLVISTLSAANSALYVASRALYGMSVQVSWDTWGLRKAFKYFNARVSHHARVPIYAVIFSFASVFWIIALTVRAGAKGIFLSTVTMNSMATVSTIMVWLMYCVAFMRYQSHYGKWKGVLSPAISTLLTRTSRNPSLIWLPPRFGIIGCVALIIIFNTASIWGNFENVGSNVMSAFGVPVLIMTFWVLMKGVKLVRNLRNPALYLSNERPSTSTSIFSKKLWSSIFISNMDLDTFEDRVLKLGNRIDPTNYPIERDSRHPETTQLVQEQQTGIHKRESSGAFMQVQTKPSPVTIQNLKVDSSLNSPPPVRVRAVESQISCARDSVCTVSREVEEVTASWRMRSDLVPNMKRAASTRVEERERNRGSF